MDIGEVVRTAYFNESRPDGLQLGWKPPKGKVFVFVCLGVEDKKVTEDSDRVNADEVMNGLGWVLTDSDGGEA